MVKRWWPPTLGSISTVSRGTDQPTGANQAASWSGSVNAR
jgi:hypothetical protein